MFGESGESHGPYTAGNSTERDFWSNTVQSDRIWVEVDFDQQSSDSSVDISIDAIAHIDAAVTPDALTNPACLVDVNCAPSSQIKDWLSTATASLLFQSGGSWYVCTGTVVSDRNDTFTPYLLTANHCIPNQAVASTLQATFRNKTPFCGGTPPDPGVLPTMVGATLLATSTVNDFSFLRLLGTVPSGITFMGWNPNSSGVTSSSPLYRVSQPTSAAQVYSTHVVSSVPTPVECSQRPLAEYIYSKPNYGGTAAGSSGAALATATGMIVGQQYGFCSTMQNTDNCDTAQTSTIDGRFSVTYPQIRQWLENESTNQACVASSNTLCMQSNRFKVTLSAHDPRTGATDTGLVMNTTNVFGYFAFAAMGSQTDPQIFVKVLDGRPVNGKWWVFYSALTDVEFTITVKDTSTNATKTYHKDPYVNGAAGADLNAF